MKQKKPTLLIHIGYPKTATTFLQRRLLKRLHEDKRIRFLGNSEGVDIKECKIANGIITTLLYKKHWGHDVHSMLSGNEGYLSGLLSDEKLNVFSSEYLCIPEYIQHPIEEMPRRIRKAFGSNVN